MAAITQAKSWSTYDSGYLQGSDSLSHDQKQIFALKTELLNRGFTVVSSSNTVSYGAADYWTADTDLIWSYSSFSWVVLEHTSGYQIGIFLNDGSVPYGTSVYSSYSGSFSGGDLENRPTASDELNGGISRHSPADNYKARVIVISDSANGNYFILLCTDDETAPIDSILFFGKPSGYEASWAEPFYIVKDRPLTGYGYLDFKCRIDSKAVECTVAYPRNFDDADMAGSYYNSFKAKEVAFVPHPDSGKAYMDLGKIIDFYVTDETPTSNDYISDGANLKRWVCIDPVFAIPNDGTAFVVNSYVTPTEYDAVDNVLGDVEVAKQITTGTVAEYTQPTPAKRINRAGVQKYAPTFRSGVVNGAKGIVTS